VKPKVDSWRLCRAAVIAPGRRRWPKATWRSIRAVLTSAWLASCFRAERARTFGAAALAAATLALSTSSLAQEASPLVVVVSNNPDAPFVRRLAAELSLFGYRVELIVPSPSDTDLDALLQASGGAALIAVDQGSQTAEVVVGERAGAGPARHDRERLDPRRRPDTNAAVLAERFRARLTELGIAPGVTTPPLASPVYLPPPPRVESPRVADHRIWVAGALGASSGGLGITPDAELELRVFPASWLSTSAFGRVSLLPAKVTAPEGHTDVRLFAGGVLIDAYPIRTDWRLRLGLGVMLVSAHMQGHADAPFQGGDDSVLVPAAIFEAGASFRVAPRVAAELRGFVGACTPRVGVRFAGRDVARFGQPLVGATFGVAVGVF
jgi:hypothetical protein